MRALRLVLVTLLVGCGARTALKEPPARATDAGTPPVVDGGRDAGIRDAGPPDGGGVDAAICGGPCGDGVFCNGEESCDPRTMSCVPGPPPDCDDGDECTRDSCNARADECRHVREERDEDGDGVGACEGDCDDRDPERAPGRPEVCEGLDNDCDGRVDEGVLSECGDCRPGCHQVTIPDADGWDTSTSSGVEVDGMGRLRLSETRTETYFAWIANTLFGTVTKLDTRDGTQAAEYDGVLLDGSNDARPPGERCRTDAPGGNCPSRTAVDLRGAVYIANRAFFNQGTVTKIAGLEADCIDRNGNGRIDTSRDLDGDGRIERGVRNEFLGQNDECILWTVNVGGVGGVPRAIAVDASGSVWVGLHDEGTVVQLDPNDGRTLRTVTLPRTGPGGRFRPYGAVGDGSGNIWLVESASGNIISIDAATGAFGARLTAPSRGGMTECPSSYGIAVDARDRVWIAGFLCPSVFRYDPAGGRWFEVRLPDSGVTRGIAADASGRIYAASSHEWILFGPSGPTASDPISRLTVFDADTGGAIRIYGTAASPLPGLGSTGVGLASDGMVWLVNQESSSATRIDPASGTARDFPVGENPYTYSDFTGFALRTFTAPNGYLRTVVAGCAMGPTEWERLDWTANVPRGSRIEVRARSADRVTDLGAATWVGPYTTRPTDLALPPGPVATRRYLELEITLISEDERTSPRITDVTVQYHCPI